jgi:tetratricopeptide (TPR) repeat protein
MLPATLCAAVLAALLAGAPPALAADDKPPEKNSPLIQKYYDEAFKSYTQGDYREAILKWTAIIKEAPEQTTAPAMILEARQKILLATKERRQRAFDFIAEGRYKDALQELQALLDQDPGDPQLQLLQTRLEGVIKLSPSILAKTKAAHAAVLGLKGYLTIPADLTLAHNGLRYAVELAPDEESFKKLLDLLIGDYPVLATIDPVTPGMKLLDYKNYVALHQIYDGKYHTAVLTLDEILILEPEDLTALKRLGSAYYSLGRMNDARAAWTAALKLAPKDQTLKEFIAKTRAPAARTYTNSETTP